MFLLVVGREPVVRGFQDELAPLALALRADGANARVRRAAQFECVVPTVGEVCAAFCARAKLDLVCARCGEVYQGQHKCGR